MVDSASKEVTFRDDAPVGDEAEGGEEYQTGNDYEALDQQSKELNLEGDGLDALDADMGPPKTRALEQILAEPSGEEEAADDANATRAGPPLSLEISAGPDIRDPVWESTT